MEEGIIAKLTLKDDKYACAFADKIILESQESKMKEHGVVKSRKDGKEVYYSLDDAHVAEIFEITVEHITHMNV